MNTTHRIPIVTVIGSSRPGSYTAKAVALVDDEIRQISRPLRCPCRAQCTTRRSHRRCMKRCAEPLA
jgi:hypothetical protein